MNERLAAFEGRRLDELDAQELLLIAKDAVIQHEIPANAVRFHAWGKSRGLNPDLTGDTGGHSPEEYWNSALEIVEQGEISLRDSTVAVLEPIEDREWDGKWRIKRALEMLRSAENKREYVEVDDIDVEVAIAESIQLMPPDTTYEEKGVPVLEYLKKHGYQVMQTKEHADEIVRLLKIK